MFTASKVPTRRSILATSVAATMFGLALLAGGLGQSLEAQDRVGPPIAKPAGRPEKNAVPTAREILGPAAVVPLAEQPPAKIFIDPPLPDQLALGRAVIQYRTENLRVMPGFGTEALAVSPRIGHLHVTVDDNPWVTGVWHGTNGGELILGNLPPGPHKVRIELETPNHKPITHDVVKFEVPERSVPKDGENQSAVNAEQRRAETSPAKLIVDAPLPEELSRGLVLFHYRTENVEILPVYGPAAATVTPRIGHIQITVDDGPWYRADATGQPVVVNGLPAGPHKIQIELVDANHKRLAQEVVKFEVPRR